MAFRSLRCTFPLLRSSAALYSVLLLSACSSGGGGGGTGVDTEVASVVVSAPQGTMEAGATLQLSAQARTASGSPLGGKGFTWSSSSTATAEVSATGQVTGVAPGSVIITATETGSQKAGTVSLSVTPAAVSTVTVSPTAASVIAGQTQQLTAEVRDARGSVLTGRAIAWSSSDTALAKVDANGLVTGSSVGGPVTITATTEGRSATAQVTVAPVPVASVAVTPAGPHQLYVGGSVDLDAVAKDAQGNALVGRVVTWSSANPAVAPVNSVGVVNGAAAGGPVTITATVDGKTATAQVTVSAVPVASISVSPASASVLQGSTQQLTATLRDSGGNTLTGRSVVWTSSDATVASVDASGRVSALDVGGPVTITASAEGRNGTAQITVVARTASRIAVTPRFATISTGATTALQASAFDAAGVAIPDPSVTWRSGATGTATVSTSGVASGVAPGEAAITATVDAAVDTTWVAVLSSGSLLSTAFVGGSVKPTLTPGQVVTVPVILDLSRVSAGGDLGSVQFDLLYDPAILTYQSAQGGVQGSVNHNVPTPGMFKFAFAATEVQGIASLTLVTVTFQVSPSAPVGTQRLLRLNYTAVPTNTAVQPYSIPIAVGGRFKVVAP